MKRPPVMSDTARPNWPLWVRRVAAGRATGSVVNRRGSPSPEASAGASSTAAGAGSGATRSAAAVPAPQSMATVRPAADVALIGADGITAASRRAIAVDTGGVQG